MKSEGAALAAVEIRDWRAEDFDRLDALSAHLSADTLRLRFRSGVRTVPVTYLRGIRTRWTSTWESVAASSGGELIGWAEIGWLPGAPKHADVAVCVIDDEQGHGVGTALLGAITARARALGVTSLHVDIATENVAARRAWRSITGSARSTVPLVA